MPHSYPPAPQDDPGPPPPPSGTSVPPGHAPARHASPTDSPPPPPTTPPSPGHAPTDTEPKGYCSQCCINMHCGDVAPWDRTHGTPTTLAFVASQQLTCPEATTGTTLAGTFTNSGQVTKACPSDPFDATTQISTCAELCVCLWIWNVDPATIPHCGPYISAVIMGCPLLDGNGNPFPNKLDPPCPHVTGEDGVFYGEIDVKRAVHLREQPPPCPDVINGGTHHQKAVQQADCTWLCVTDDGVPQTCPAGTYSLHGDGLPPCCRTTCTPAPAGNCDICHTPPGDCSGPDNPLCFDIFGDAANPADCPNYCPNSPTTQERRSHFFLTGCPDDGMGHPQPWIKGCNPKGPQHHYTQPNPVIDVTDDWGNFYIHLVNACSPGDYLDVFCVPPMGSAPQKPCNHKTVRPGCHGCLQWDADPSYRDVITQLHATGKGIILGRQPPAAPVDGPGSQLEWLLKLLAIRSTMGCGCAQIKEWMNRLGVAGCRRHVVAIANIVRKRAAGLSRGRWWLGVVLAVITGIAFRVGWRDPVSGVILLAIRRAAKKERRAEQRSAVNV